MGKPILPDGWKIVDIENILAVQPDGKLIHQGWSPQCDSQPAGESEWGVLKTTAVQDGYFLENENKRLPDDKEPKPRIEVQNGDILVTNAGPRNRCGVICYVKSTRSKLMISGKMYRLRFPEQAICPLYIELWLRTSRVQKELNDRKTGISESGLNMIQARFLTLPILLIPLAEQKAISNSLNILLAQVETTKARLERIIDTLQSFRQSVLTAAVNGKLTEEWRTTAGIEWPKEKSKLGELVELAYGKSLPAKTRSGDGFPVFGSNGIIGFHKDYLVSGPFIVVGRKGSYGEVTWSDTNGWPIDTTYFVNLKQPSNLKFIFFLLQTLGLNQLNRSTAIPGLNREDAYAQPVTIPMIDEQIQIAHRAEELFDFADSIEKKTNAAIDHVSNLTQSILSKAFSGDITAKWRDVNQGLISGDNSVEALLAKIKKERKAMKPAKKTSVKKKA